MIRTARSVVRSLILLALLLAATVDGMIRKRFFGLQVGPQGAVWVHRWCRRIVRLMGIGFMMQGPMPEAGERGLAVVSNHLSYLDILLYSAARPFIMVSKTEVRGWPLIGWITAQAGTIYVERADVAGGQKQTHAEVNAAMAKAFRSGLPVLFFPEGTTTDGSGILPFRRGLFNSVVYGQVPVRTAAVHYSLDQPNPGASVANDVCYWGDMVFGPHIFACLGLRGVRAKLQFGDLVPGEDRFALAINSREQVVRHYEQLAGQQPALAQTGKRLLDRPVEGLGSLYDQRGAQG
jgi:1-acyl-sn-glycerol-3-phosphate acyltransferase